MKKRYRGIVVFGISVMAVQSCVATDVNIWFDGFEGYGITASLANAWPDDASDDGVQALATSGAQAGSNCMQFAYTVNNNPSGVFLDRVVNVNFSEDQNWSSFTTFKFYYRGQAGNSADDIYFELRDQYGGKLGSASLANATTSTAWTLATIDLSGYGNVSNGTSLANVRQLVVGVSGVASFGTGTVYFDSLGGTGGSIPTLSEWGMILLMLALVTCAIFRMPRLAPVRVAAAAVLVAMLPSRGLAEMVDDFESYADSPALVAGWVPVDNATVSLETPDVQEGAKALRCAYSVGTPPFRAAVLYSFGSDQDWSGRTHFVIWYKGDAGNSDETLSIQLQDTNGVTIGEALIPGGTKTNAWTPWFIDMSGWNNGDGRGHVRRIKLNVAPSSFGSGVVLFDFAQMFAPPTHAAVLVNGALAQVAWNTPFWASESNVAYSVWASTNVVDGPWTNATPASPVTATSAVTATTLALDNAIPAWFFQVRLNAQ